MSDGGVLPRILALWGELTETDVSWDTVRLASRPGERSLADSYGDIRQALDLDPGGVTAVGIVEARARRHLRDRTFSLLEMVERPDEAERLAGVARRLLAALSEPEVATPRAGFVDAMRRAVDHYGAGPREDVARLLGEPARLFELRLRALRSMAQLRVGHFLVGDPEPEGVRPKVAVDVVRFPNVNSLLEAACRSPSGLSLAMIQDDDPYAAHFAVTVRNGANLTILSDAPKYDNPLLAQARRRPDQDVERRAELHLFPYGLVRFDDRVGDVPEAKGVPALVARQSEGRVLAPIADLPPDRLVWLAMVLDLAADRFWHSRPSDPVLSYTGESVVLATPLLDAAREAGLPAVRDTRLALPPVTARSLSEATERQVGVPGLRRNGWMERRYGPEVDPATLALVAAPRHLRVAAQGTGPFTSRSPLPANVPVVALDPTVWGTAEDIEADRLFLARHNQARAVTALAREEFERERDGVMAWYRKRLLANRDGLFAMIVGGEDLYLDTWRDDRDTVTGYAPDGQVVSGRRFAYRLPIESNGLARDPWRNGTITLGSVSLDGRKPGSRTMPTCLLKGCAPSWFFGFDVRTAADLALVTATPVGKLPAFLRDHDVRRTYAGNHHLNRIDPLDWAAADPWRSLKLDVGLYLSRRALNEVTRRVEPVTWGARPSREPPEGVDVQPLPFA